MSRWSSRPTVAAVTGLALALGLGLTGPVPLATATTPQEVATARAEAAQLRRTLDLLDAREARLQERLAWSREQLAQVVHRSVEAERALVDADADADAAQQEHVAHVRALFMTGGPAALYATVLAGSDPAEAASRLFTVERMVAADVDALGEAGGQVAAATAAAAQRAAHATARARLAGRVTAMTAELSRLRQATASALGRADQQVVQLAAALARQREQAAAAAARTWAGAVVDTPAGPVAEAAVAAALAKLGSPYVWGDEGPETFDCSGLVQWAYARAGVAVPRLASQQYFAGTPVPLDRIRPGDVVVYAYDTADRSTIHHITLYIGGGNVVHAPRTGDVVRVAPLSLTGLYGVARLAD